MIKITASQLQNAVGMSAESAQLWLAPVNEAGQDCDLNTIERWVMWLAQCAHESLKFTRLAESFNYDAKRLLIVFPKYFTPETAAAVARSDKAPANQKAIAEIVYGGRMGNRKGTSDAWDYRGGGLPQLTGREMYEKAGDHLGIDLLAEPDLIRTSRRYAAKVAAFFWDTRGMNKYADQGDIVGATKALNGGTNGLDGPDGRRACMARAASAFGGSAATELARILGRPAP